MPTSYKGTQDIGCMKARLRLFKFDGNEGNPSPSQRYSTGRKVRGHHWLVPLRCRGPSVNRRVTFLVESSVNRTLERGINNLIKLRKVSPILLSADVGWLTSKTFQAGVTRMFDLDKKGAPQQVEFRGKRGFARFGSHTWVCLEATPG